MNKFLIQNKQLFKKRLQNQFKTNFVHFIIGNSSCDLDSCVSAIVLAWIKQQSQETNFSLCIPVMNIYQSRFSVRTEIVQLFNDMNILPESLLFRNEINFDPFIRSKDFKISLVDHHVFCRADNYLDEYVVEIIDHRDQARTIPNNVNVNIALVGSCSTLIAEMLKNSGIVEVPSCIKRMLLGAILVDTNNISPTSSKTTERDINMAEWLCSNKSERESLYKKLEKAKYSIDHLSTFDILIKDLKLVEGLSGSIAFSSIHKHSSLFASETDIECSVEQCSDENGSFGWIGLFPVIHHQSESYKPILIWSRDKDVIKEFASSLISNTYLDIEQFEEKLPSSNFVWVKMKNVKRTRKQVLPVVKSFLDEFKL